MSYVNSKSRHHNNFNTRITSNKDYKSCPILFGYAWLCATLGTWNSRLMIMFHNTHF